MSPLVQTLVAAGIVALAAAWWLWHTFGRGSHGACGGCEAGRRAQKLARSAKRRD